MLDPTTSANDEVITGGCSFDDVFQCASQGATATEDHVADSVLANDPVLPQRHSVRSSTSYYSLTGSDSCLVGSIPASPSSTGNASDISKDQSFYFLQNAGPMEQSVIKDALQAENEFIHYALSFPKKVTENSHSHSTDSKKNSVEVSPKVGLDHLDNLCKLMEQLSELKEANVKLKRKVQYLEDLKALHEIHREMLHLSASRDPPIKEPRLSIGPPSPVNDIDEISINDLNNRSSVDRLQRSKTTTHVNTKAEHAKHEHGHRSRSAAKDVSRERSKSVGHPDHSKNKSRSSRWSKVKAVLGIEKSETQHDVHAGQMQLLSTKNDPKDKKSDGVNAERSSPRCRGSSSVHSRNRNRHSAVIADEAEENHQILRNASSINIRGDQWNEGLKKYSKTTWGKMKTIIQSRRGESRNQRTENGFATSKSYTDVCAEVSVPEQQNLKRSIRAPRKSSFGSKDLAKPCLDKELQNKSNTLHICEGIVDHSNVRQTSPAKQNSTDVSRKPSRDRSSSKKSNDFEVGPNQSVKCSSKNDFTKDSQVANRNKSSKIYPECIESESKPSSSEAKGDHSICKMISHFPKETSEVVQPKDDPAKSKRMPTPVSCTSATVTELLKELQQNLSDDFNKKLEEWHRVRNEGSKPAPSDVERKDSFGRLRKFSKPDKIKTPVTEKLTKHSSIVQKKDLHWLEKELQKVEREIIRLSKEKQKFEKRALRLMCLKEAMQESQMKNNEVFVKTAAGEFRFEGISNAFTKKLYEWETKRGVGPELSTIVLLDESLKTQDFQPRESKSITDIDKRSLLPSNSELLTDRFVGYRLSKSSSEPDFSTLSNSTTKDTESSKSAIRCQSGDTFLSFGNDSQVSTCRKDDVIEKSVGEISRDENSTELQHSREDYCSLLEENIFLLDQLKDKEHVCAKLQSELDRLDEKAGKANIMHKEELEKYRQKLWEIHMSRPKDLQGSLQLISELKMRIEELHKCSDKLKSDREKLEENFRRNSEQQKTLSDDLINRILDMQEKMTDSVQRNCGSRGKCRKHCKCGAVGMVRIHEISAKLLKQARDMEEALSEKTRQVCHLRWELLLRDMSTVLLQAALHRVTYQRPQATLLPTWDVKRMKFKAIKAWSIDSTERRQSEVTIAEDWLQERLKQLSITPYKQWMDDFQFDNSGLIGTVHELEKEVMSIESCESDHCSDPANQDGAVNCYAESEAADSDRNYDSGSVLNSRSSSFSSGPSPEIRESCSDTRLYQRSRSLSIHRNSSSSMSCVSGFEASESSSMHDSDKIQNFMRKRCLPLKTRRTNRWSSKENVSSSCSSRSSIHDGDPSNRLTSYMDDEDEDDDPRGSIYASGRQHDAHYIRMIEAEDLANREFETQSWSNQCLITPRRMHIMPHVQPESTSTSAADAQRARAETQADIDCDVFFSSEESDTNNYEESAKPGPIQQPDCHPLCATENRLSTKTAKTNYTDFRTAACSDQYSTGEGRASFMPTRKEQEHFTDIRTSSQPSNCYQSPFNSTDRQRDGSEPNHAAPLRTVDSASSNLDSTRSTSAEGAVYENASNTFTYRYKETQGFGRKPKSLYRDGIL